MEPRKRLFRWSWGAREGGCSCWTCTFANVNPLIETLRWASSSVGFFWLKSPFGVLMVVVNMGSSCSQGSRVGRGWATEIDGVVFDLPPMLFSVMETTERSL